MINNVAPGVLFYYTNVVATSTSPFVFDIVQTHDSQREPRLDPVVRRPERLGLHRQLRHCRPRRSRQPAGPPGVVRVTITNATAGATYVANIKIDPSTVKGAPRRSRPR